MFTTAAQWKTSRYAHQSGHFHSSYHGNSNEHAHSMLRLAQRFFFVFFATWLLLAMMLVKVAVSRRCEEGLSVGRWTEETGQGWDTTLRFMFRNCFLLNVVTRETVAFPQLLIAQAFPHCSFTRSHVFGGAYAS